MPTMCPLLMHMQYQLLLTTALKERYYLQFTNEENQHFQDAFYSKIIQEINLENCYQWGIVAGKGRVGDRGERNQSGNIAQVIFSWKMTLQLT